MKSWAGKKRKYTHIKRDGMNIEVNTHHGKALTRIGHDMREKIGYIVPSNIFSLNLGVLYCELWCPGKPASYIKTGLIEKDPAMRLDVWGATECGALAPLEKVEQFSNSIGMHFIPFTEFDETIIYKPLPTDVEGYVFKDANFLNHEKWKPHFDVDLVILDFVPGNGKYANTLGALIVGLYDKTVVARISGMTDLQREELWNTKPYGRVVEVRHSGILSKGGLRHPRFVRFRDDKPAKECTSVSSK